MVISGRDSGQESADKGLSVHHRGFTELVVQAKKWVKATSDRLYRREQKSTLL